MPLTKKFQFNFNRGEASRQVEGRPDLAQFQNACKTLVNFWIYPEGGIFRRYGSRRIARAKYDDKLAVNIPFKFNISDAFNLEFGHLYIRFYKNKAPITVSGDTPLELESPYEEGDLRNLQWRQSADVLFLVDGRHRPYKLSRVTDSEWHLTPFVPLPPPTVEEDTNIALIGNYETLEPPPPPVDGGGNGLPPPNEGGNDE